MWDIKAFLSIIIFYFFVFQGFTLISNNSNCEHIKGGRPSHCKRYEKSGTSLTPQWCEDFCSSYEHCVGYYVNFDVIPFCSLITSNGKCPEPNEDPRQGFVFIPEENTAESLKDLVPVFWPAESKSLCKGKQSSKTH